jgi:Protein of unknown function (DUF2441)
MVEIVQGKRLYQVTVTNNYKVAFVAGQTVQVGRYQNPFFKFYESSMEYPIIDSQMGTTVMLNCVEWIHRVRNKTVQTSYDVLAEKAFEVSQHYMMLARELVMEQIRVEEFDGRPPSRQTCLFLTESIEEAHGWLPLLGGQGAICELVCTGIIHRADSRLMVTVSEPLSITKDKARDYWRGGVGAAPRIEVLFQGEAVVSTVGL